jgi:poly(beta-D-mannuronate) lyase
MKLFKNFQLLFILTSVVFYGCEENKSSLLIPVGETNTLEEAIKNAQPGDEIILMNGVWEDLQIRFTAEGTADKPIVLRAETSGKVLIQGESDLKFGGDYLIVDGLHFTNGFSTSKSVIEFGISDDLFANHCKLVNCVIEDFNKTQRNQTDLWVLFKGRHNEMEHCYLAGKSNRGPTIRVDLEGNESIKNYHKIINNHFGPRPPKGGPSAETIQIGNSSTSMTPSYTLVANNLFEACNGEVEIISSKSNFNEFRNNVFYKSEGSLVTRHGNYCTIDGNYFIGDEHSENIGGIRLIGSGHKVTNNYFYKLKGENFRSPLAVMNGIPKSPLNRYIQVTDVVVAYNSWINCKSPLQFGVGANLDEKEVLPASEIRSDRPIRTTVANNLIFNKTGDPNPIVAHDRLDGINFKSNLINNQGTAFEPVDGLVSKDFELTALTENVWVPKGNLPEMEIFQGFEFDQISKDLFGVSRSTENSVGAVVGTSALDPEMLNSAKYGPAWFSANASLADQQTHSVASSEALIDAISKAKEGDIIELKNGNYELSTSLKINKRLTIQGADASSKATILYTGKPQTPAFEMNPKGQLTLSKLHLKGTKTQYAFASLDREMSSLYNLYVMDCTITDFDYILKAYKYSFAEHLSFKTTTFKDCNNGLELSEETEDKGEYNAENILIDSCYFEAIDANVVDYYRGGYDESTVGGNLIISNSTFTQCGAEEKNGILLNTYGIINVAITNNQFLNNRVKLVAQLWGAKNNRHANNTISDSGKIEVKENLELNLLY